MTLNDTFPNTGSLFGVPAANPSGVFLYLDYGLNSVSSIALVYNYSTGPQNITPFPNTGSLFGVPAANPSGVFLYLDYGGLSTPEFVTQVESPETGSVFVPPIISLYRPYCYFFIAQ